MSAQRAARVCAINWPTSEHAAAAYKTAIKPRPSHSIFLKMLSDFDFYCYYNAFFSLLNHQQGRLPAAAAPPINGDCALYETPCKRAKLEPPSETPKANRATAMVCNVTDIMEALKTQQQLQQSPQLQHQQQQQQQQQQIGGNETSCPTKVATAIMMDANSAKNLVNQILAAAAAGQGKIEVGGTMPSALAGGDQALDMSVSTPCAFCVHMKRSESVVHENSLPSSHVLGGQ